MLALHFLFSEVDISITTSIPVNPTESVNLKTPLRILWDWWWRWLRMKGITCFLYGAFLLWWVSYLSCCFPNCFLCCYHEKLSVKWNSHQRGNQFDIDFKIFCEVEIFWFASSNLAFECWICWRWLWSAFKISVPAVYSWKWLVNIFVCESAKTTPLHIHASYNF